MNDLIGKLISHYKILEKLGEGGMGVVYKAEDIKLKRIVALKFLPHHLSISNDDNIRLLNEAQMTAKLNHPHICTVHDIEEADNGKFIVMEFVDGITLRTKIKESALSIEESINYAIQIGEALEEAHSQGVIHRDIKPDNIMINSKNQIKVMDFGIAKLKEGLGVTRTMSTSGTLSYMAPEQLTNSKIDGRVDIFSLGVLLYEMLTSRLPFRGDHQAAIMYSIMNEEPEPINKYISEVSSEMLHVLNRALEKDPEDRYQSVADMVSELKRVRKQSSKVTRINTAGASPNPEEQLNRSTKETPTISFRWSRTVIIGAILLVVCAVAVYAYFTFFGSHETIDSLAVLPFVNTSNDPEKEYLTEGITENIINKMSGLSHLRVIPRSLVARYEGKNVDPRQVGKELNVRAVLTGKVVQRGDELSIQTELIDIQNVSQMWGEQYNKKMSDLISVEEDIIRNVSGRLATKTSGGERRELAVSHTTNPEAYRLYLKGRFYWNKRTKEGIQKAMTYVQQAIDADPEYALAYSGIADCYLITAVLSENPAEYLLKLKAAALKALELDNGLAEPHASLGLEKAYYEFDFPGAEQELRRAIALNPNYATGHHWLGFFLSYFRRFDEAIAEYKKALDLDPLSLAINSDFGLAYYYSRQYDLAIEQLKKTIDMDPNFVRAHYLIMLPYLKKDMPNAAFKELIKGITAEGDSAETIERVKKAYLLSGFKGIAKLEIQRGRKFANATTLLDIARSYLAAGDRGGALHALEEEYAAHKYYIITINADPYWDDLREEPRFKVLMKKMGFEK